MAGHLSQFTEKSFEKIILAGGDLLHFGTAYGKEVVGGLTRLGLSKNSCDQKKSAQKFFQITEINVTSIKSQFQKLSKLSEPVTISGGIGKAATFIQHYLLTVGRFPFYCRL